MTKMDLYSHAWCDVVFLNKNKEYGAYDLRKNSGKRHLIAFAIVSAACMVAFIAPKFVSAVIPSTREVIDDVTRLSIVKVDEIKPPIEIPREYISQPLTKTTIRFTPPVIKEDDQVKAEDEIKTQEEMTNSFADISIKNHVGNDEVNGKDIAELEQQIAIVDNSTAKKPHLIVEVMPEFPGGEAMMRKHIAETLHYPTIAQENGLSGTVFVSFVVAPDGSISEAKVLRGFDKSCEEEALRVVRNMPLWKPGKQNGVPVYVQFQMPIKFQLRQ